MELESYNRTVWFNARPYCVCVVAVIKHQKGDRNDIFDWGAYIAGIDPNSPSEESAGMQAAYGGGKLLRHFAMAFFPNLPEDKYRD